jgi:hypothetical protein
MRGREKKNTSQGDIVEIIKNKLEIAVKDKSKMNQSLKEIEDILRRYSKEIEIDEHNY